MRLKEKLLTSLLLVPLTGTSAWAKDRVNYDAFLASPEAKGLPATEQQLQARGARVELMEERLGLPTVLWNEQLGAQSASTLATLRPDQAARAHLQKFADLYRLTTEDISGATLNSVHQTEFGPLIARFGQKVGGIEVFRSGVNVVMDRKNNLVAITGYLTPHEAVAARLRSVGTDFPLSAADASARAFKDLTGTAISGRSLVATGTQADFTHLAFEPGVSTVLPHAMGTPIRVKKVYYTLPDGLQPAYYLELSVGTKSTKDSEYYSYVVSATDGTVLFRNNLTADAAFTYRVWADPSTYIPYDGPMGNDPTPHPTGTPDRYQAPYIPANVLTLQNVPFSRNDAWLPNGATQTTGNNADAYVDLGAPDGYQPETDLRPGTTAPGVFDYTYDVTKSPAFSINQRKAATVHLFYLNNFLHDWFYDSGFDEAAGNAQAQNFGRGGLENDSIKAEAQDYGGRNNANMSTPSDGARPRMQMYIFDGVPALQVLGPASQAGYQDAGSASFGPTIFDQTGDVKILDPAGTTLGCTAFPAGTFTGKVAVIDRGTCDFNVKAQNAQTAGAVAVLIANNAANQAAPGLGGTNPLVTVPTMSITLETANAWKNEVRTNGSTISVRMTKTADLDRDGTIDNAIVAHEWGHYISNRLVGNSNGLINNAGRSLGEGWGDFHAMLMVVQEADRNRAGNSQFQGVYAMAGYTSSGGANNGNYFGIRRVPYSTDLNKNGLTYKHFANGNALPTNHPIQGVVTGAGNSEVHNAGEVWATMLWECYASLLNAYPFQEAQSRMKQYLVAAYKATPIAPTLLEARDAVLAVAAASDPADYARFAAAFAKRGAGFGAKSGDRNSVDHVGVVESFSAGSNLEVTSIRLDDSATACDADGVLDVGEVGLLTVTVRNSGDTVLSSFSGTVTASGATATIQFPSGNTLIFPSLPRNGTATRTIQVRLNSVTGTAPRAGLSIAFNEPSLPAASRTASYNARVHYDEVLNNSVSDTFESSLSAWTYTNYGRLPGFGIATEVVSGTPNRYLHVADHGVLSDTLVTSPWFTVNATGNFILTYRYRMSLEGTPGGSGLAAPFYDGVVLEWTDDGINWYDSFNDLGRNPGYAAYLAIGDNPLSDRPAFVGTNAAFPGWTSGGVNMGTILAGGSFRFRFRIGTDSEAGAYGFDLDDVALTNVSSTPFGALVTETSDGNTCNRRPVADAGLNRTVTERDASGNLATISLNGTGSFDPDGQALTYAWTQVSGPAVTINNPTSATPSFTADVELDTLFTFQLVVSDGTDSSLPKQVQIGVVNSNRAPVALITGPATVAERSQDTITLDGSTSSDVDGEPLTYQWSQTGGEPLNIADLTSPTLSFRTPEVTADTAYQFSLVVNDGYVNSTAATFTVTVTNVDRAPSANAGADQTVDGRTAVTLSGSGADEDGDDLSYAWTQNASDAVQVTLAGADTTTATFTSPDVKTATTLHFTLTVSANGQSATDEVAITVRPDKAPAVNAGVDQLANGRSSVTLYGSASDPEDDAITYQWTQAGADLAQVVLTGANTATATFTSPDVKIETVLHFTLTVTANGLSASDDVTVTVRADGAPVANAGADRTVNSADSVTLQGFGSDPENDSVAYAWTQESGPSVTLTGANTATPSFTAPNTSSGTSLVFKLTITANGLSATDTVTVTVSANRAPTANAGADRTVNAGNSVTLQGFGSDPENDALTYAWTQESGSSVTLTGADTATPSFTAPNTSTSATLVFKLTVTANGQSATDTVSITVNAREDGAPVANAGADRSVVSRDTVTLQGFGSDPENDALTYAWTQESGPSVTLEGAGTATPSFTAPNTKEEIVLVFKLTITANGQSATDTVSITVKKFNRRPEAKASTAAETNEGTAVTLDASESTDPDEDALTYTWVQTGGPAVQLEGSNTSKPTFTAPQVSSDTTLSFNLVVTDADGAKSDVVSVSIKVVNVNKAPVADARKLAGGEGKQSVTLDASLSSDADGDKLTYKWEQTAGETVSLSSDKEPSVTFTAPDVKSNTTLTFKVTVTDSHGASSTKEVQVEITPAKSEGGCASTGNSSGGAMLLAALAGLFLSRRRFTLRA
ncbi:myxosortase-dependent M36 family metallopeptidase [Hyalangium minutum]|uniref:Chitinase n=1 Tax=Hyalangium minutum TaxID=394096 RepID=A0A085W333_9BACT|nr:myxosortase-dependent M36 family metallopeptidase [Hyalangium minutum]KFE62096.1 Chitinase [Hyalangium minutum]